MSFDYYKVIKEIKSQPCMDCGLTFDPVCMDLDHRPDEIKLGGVSKFRHDEAAFYAEVAKCDLVCACCHRLRGKMRGFSETHLRNLKKPKSEAHIKAMATARRGKKMSPETHARLIAEGKLGRPRVERIERPCTLCGRTIILPNTDRRVAKKHVYCDRQCMFTWRRDNPGWKNAGN